MKSSSTLRLIALLVLHLGLSSCGQNMFFADAINPLLELRSGDILVVAGGTVAQTATPFPLHQIVAFTSDGLFKKVIHRRTTPTEMLMGATMHNDGNRLLFTVDTSDFVAQLDITQPTLVSNHLLDSTNLTGATLRSVAQLSDDSTIVVESTTVIEKYSSSGSRVTTNFPITLTANVMHVKKISGNRFAAVFTGGDDRVRIYNNDGTLAATITNTGLACGTNCDPNDIVELSDGRFVIAFSAAAIQGLEIYSSSFVRIGTFYRNSAVLPLPYTVTETHDGSVLSCSSTFNTCEKFQVVGSTGVRIGSSAFIGDTSLIRQPTDVVVIP
jgi:hypothetical protein